MEFSPGRERQDCLFPVHGRGASSADRMTAVYRSARTGHRQDGSLRDYPACRRRELCVTPCSIERPVETEVQLAAPEAPEPGRLPPALPGLAGSKNPIRTVMVTADPVSYAATYRRQFRLCCEAIRPPAPSCNRHPHRWTASTMKRPQWRSPHQSGSASVFLPGLATCPASLRPGLLTLDGPKTSGVAADPVPAISAAGVRSAASDVPRVAVWRQAH